MIATNLHALSLELSGVVRASIFKDIKVVETIDIPISVFEELNDLSQNGNIEKDDELEYLLRNRFYAKHLFVN